MRHRRRRAAEDQVLRLTTLGTEGFADVDDEPRGAHVVKGQAPTDQACGAHAKKGDPLLVVEHRALHAVKVELFSTRELGLSASEARAAVSGVPTPAVRAGAVRPEVTAASAVMRQARGARRHGARATARRRWRLVPVGAAAALTVGLGGGAAFAFFTGGPGSGDASTGSPVAVKATATTGAADLLPGGAGTAYFVLHNPNSFAATFGQVAPGATVVSDDTSLCPSSYVSIAPAMPYSIPTAITLGPDATSDTQSIAGLVKLAPNAPTTCQGVTFTVTLTLSGQSSS